MIAATFALMPSTGLAAAPITCGASPVGLGSPAQPFPAVSVSGGRVINAACIKIAGYSTIYVTNGGTTSILGNCYNVYKSHQYVGISAGPTFYSVGCPQITSLAVRYVTPSGSH